MLKSFNNFFQHIIKKIITIEEKDMFKKLLGVKWMVTLYLTAKTINQEFRLLLKRCITM